MVAAAAGVSTPTVSKVLNGRIDVSPGTPTAYYSGLKAHHGYTVIYTPYTAKNGSPIQGAIPGRVYFVS